MGITRARNKLFLTYTEFRRLYGQDSYNLPSRFINEIPQECLEFVRPKQTYKNSFYGSVVSESLKQDGNEYTGRSSYKSFGEGVILSIEGQGDSARIQIHFDAVEPIACNVICQSRKI